MDFADRLLYAGTRSNNVARIGMKRPPRQREKIDIGACECGD